jgi:site-specific DNA-methyltransferase (adenine-specific)
MMGQGRAVRPTESGGSEMLMLPAFTGAPEVNRVYHTDLFTLCDAIPDQSVDMVLCDPPYGTIACAWDTVIPFTPMWSRFKRIVKPRGVVVMTASQPFTSALVMSNPDWFRCEWIWRKPQGTGYLNANRQPMKNHESIIVFAAGAHNYYPQKRKGAAYRATSGSVGGFVRDKTVGGYLTVNDGDRYPLSVLEFDSETGLHPTQKPVKLFEYLIASYTQVGDLVVDPTCGSGTTARAARNTNRRYICGDTTLEYVLTARDSLRLPFQKSEKPVNNDLSGLPRFAEGVA